jgi:hypothetical protein
VYGSLAVCSKDTLLAVLKLFEYNTKFVLLFIVRTVPRITLVLITMVSPTYNSLANKVVAPSAVYATLDKLADKTPLKVSTLALRILVIMPIEFPL